VQAVILAGGEGTRLQPLTSRAPKPVVTLADRPFIVFMLEWLAGHGVSEVILCCGFLAARVREVLGDGAAYGVRLRYIDEVEPLGTGGAIKNAAELLEERFLVCNGDVLTDMDLSAQIEQHERSGATATLALMAVPDPSAYGLVRLAGDASVVEFVEKPPAGAASGGLISAGAYVLERSVVERIAAGRSVSIEREIWPQLVGNGLFGYVAGGYWLDIGSPERYLQGTFDIIDGLVATSLRERLGPQRIAIDPTAQIDGEVVGPALIGADCKLAGGSRVGSQAVLGRAVSVGEDAVVERAVVLDGAEIGAGSFVRDCIVAERAKIGPHSELSGNAVIGEDAVIGAHNVIANGLKVFPGVELGERAIGF
jgi:mannose-1-phosphate guanylyltransferase